jgi:hypothetical protein
MIHEIEIDIQDSEYQNWYDTIVRIKVEDWMSDTDIETAITEKAIEWCSRNGLNYETWDYL